MEQLDSDGSSTPASPRWPPAWRHAAQPEGRRHHYILSLAVSIPVSGWLASASAAGGCSCRAGAVHAVVGAAARAQCEPARRGARAQGIAAAMMMPVGRSVVVRSFPKSELLRVMNFIIIPA